MQLGKNDLAGDRVPIVEISRLYGCITYGAIPNSRFGDSKGWKTAAAAQLSISTGAHPIKAMIDVLSIGLQIWL
jgi:hypothetical protein